MKSRTTKYKTLKNGQRVANAPNSVAMTIDSQCPKKWAFVDMETGDIWVHKSRIPRYKDYKYCNFFRADRKALDAIMKSLHQAYENEP